VAERKKRAPAKKRQRRRSKPKAPAKGKGKDPGGRPEKIEQQITIKDADGVEKTMTTAESITSWMRLGVPQKYAAQASGVHPVTASRWITRGTEALIFAGGELENVEAKELPYASFANEVVRAKGAAVGFYVAQLYRMARAGNARATIEWLRTQAADEFRQRVGIEFEPGERKPAPLEPETAAEYRRSFVAAFGADLPEFDPGELAPPEEDVEEAEEP
jgi:hypothetical protein